MTFSRRTALVVLVLLAGCRGRSLSHEGKSAAELEAMPLRARRDNVE